VGVNFPDVLDSSGFFIVPMLLCEKIVANGGAMFDAARAKFHHNMIQQ